VIILLEDISKSISQAGKDITEGAQNLWGSIFPEEDDDLKGNNVSSGIVEDITEGIGKVVNLLDEGIKNGLKAIGIDSIGKMADEIQAEYEVADRVCDKVGGQSGQLPVPIFPDASVCFAPKQVEWALNLGNSLKTLKAATVCALEKNVSEPIDFYFSLGEVLSEDVENLAGWGLGWLAGEGIGDVLLPLVLHPMGLYLPFSYGACIQQKLAEEMGDMTAKEIEELEAETKKFTKRNKGMVKGFINGVFEGSTPLFKGITQGISDISKNIGI